MSTNKINRKKFFKRIGLSGTGLALLSIAPLRIFGTKNKLKNKISVKIHSSAVKRNS